MATISTPRAQSPAPQRVQSPTIYSPLATPTSTDRPPLEVPGVDARSTSPAPPNASQRRNRAALRDYYNLKAKTSPRPNFSRTASIASTASNGTTSTLTALEDSSFSPTFRSQLDEADFDAETYIQELLKSSNLRTVLKAEGSLVSEIKNLDGERKALVYDNYSKLITATQTIGTMRRSMDEAGGGSLRSIGMLGPAIDAVARSAAELSRGTDDGEISRKREQKASAKEERSKRETVRWVLSTPARLQKSLQAEQREEAEADWNEVQEVLGKWKEVQGAAELQAACKQVMSQPLPDGIANG
jgi:vacuolar protein sorting-associated protein 51